MKYSNLKIQLLLLLRGNFSQASMNKKLNYDYNKYSAWERGRKKIYIEHLIKILEVLNRDLLAVFNNNFTQKFNRLDSSYIINKLLQDKTVGELNNKLSFSRNRIYRILDGTKATLEELFEIIDVFYPLRLDRILNDLCKSKNHETSFSMKNSEAMLFTEAFSNYPQISLVFRYLSIKEYQNFNEHKVGYIAKKIGISINEEKTLIKYLLDQKLITKKNSKYVPENLNCHLLKDSTKILPYISYLSDLGTKYINSPSYKGIESNCFCLDLTISRTGAEKLSKKLHQFFNEAIDIVRKDKGPEEKVRVLNVQLFNPSDIFDEKEN